MESEEEFIRREGLSRVNDIQRGDLFWAQADILLWDSGLQGPTIRLGLEDFGVRVNLFPIGQARHVVRALGSDLASSEYVILAVHGEDGALPVPELDPALEAVQPYHGKITSSDLQSFVDLPGSVVISLGCVTGTDEFARAFLTGGASAYIAPQGSPLGYASTMFPMLLFYELAQMHRLKDAVERIRGWDEQFSMWRLWE